LVYGFDTGPGNALMDEICQQKFEMAFDKSGNISKSGHVQPALLNRLLKHPYFKERFPKSTGRETFNTLWLKTQLADYANPITDEDLLATLCEFTAQSIQVGIQQLAEDVNALAGDVWIVGGGAYNQHLIDRIQQALPEYCVQSSLTININPNAIEAMMCGWLAQQRIDRQAIALTSITGSSRNVVLGGLWLGH